MIKKTKIIFLADINSAHTQKWVTALIAEGIEVGLCTLSKPKDNWYLKFPSVKIVYSPKLNAQNNLLSKLIYLFALPSVKKAIREFKPDLLHSHYATSYGLIGVLSRFHPLIISAWGSDVYDFPKKSLLHKKILIYNFKHADLILSTSNIMIKEVSKYTSAKIHITPFGVDLNIFRKNKGTSLFNEKDIVFGTIKSLEKKYGINYLIESFAALSNKYPDLPLKLLIVGDGSEKHNLEELTKTKQIESKVIFTGKIPQNEVPLYHNMLYVYVALSIDDSESFGVATVEAMACGKPVVVSDVDGFREVVINGQTGIIVNRKNSNEAMMAMEKLIFDKELHENFSKNAIKHVQENYNWKNNFDSILNLYRSLLK